MVSPMGPFLECSRRRGLSPSAVGDRVESLGRSDPPTEGDRLTRTHFKRLAAMVTMVTIVSFVSLPAFAGGRDDPRFESAFVFGARDPECVVSNDGAARYTPVVPVGNDPGALAYDAARGWGYEVFDARARGFDRYGPLDGAPPVFSFFGVQGCPTDAYNSYLGAAGFAATCSERTIGNPDDPCSDGGIAPEGIIFRVDVPNGFYRFVAAVGSAEDAHAHRILAEDGGSGRPASIGSHVVLVSNFDQAQHAIGTLGAVGFSGYAPPVDAGARLTPAWIRFGTSGLETRCLPESPVLEVTNGYLRIHQLQGNSNDGVRTRDPDGGDLILLELWRVESAEIPRAPVSRSIVGSCGSSRVTVRLESAIAGPVNTTVLETLPSGSTIVDAGGGRVERDTIEFVLRPGGSASYRFDAPRGVIELSGEATPSGGCSEDVGGDRTFDPDSCPELSVSPRRLDFGTVEIGASSRLAITLENAGGEELTIESIALGEASTDFSFTPPISSTIAAGARTAVDVTFAPTERGQPTGELIIETDAPATPRIVVPLIGNWTSAEVGDEIIFEASARQPAQIRFPRPGAFDPDSLVVLELEPVDPDADGAAALHAAWERPRDPIGYDERAAEPFSLTQRLVLRARDRELFVFVAVNGRSGPVSMRLRSTASEFFVSSVAPDRAASGDDVTLAIVGGGFGSGMTARLIHSIGATEVDSSSVRAPSPRYALASFALRGVPDGPYDVLVFGPGDPIPSMRLEEAFTVIGGNQPGELDTYIRGLSAYRRQKVQIVTAAFRNTGDRTLRAPILRLRTPQSTVTGLRVSGAAHFEPDVVDLVALDLDSAPGVVPPGGAFSLVDIEVFSEQIGSGKLFLSVLDTSGAGSIDWDAVEPLTGVSPGVWSANLAAIRGVFGEDWEEYQRRLTSRAISLLPRGIRYASLTEIWRDAMREVLGRPRAAIVGDARTPEGDPIVFAHVLAIRGGSVHAVARTDTEGHFVLDGLGAGLDYTVLVDDHEGGAPLVSVPESGDLFGVDLVSTPSPVGDAWDPDCDACDDSDLPTLPLRFPADMFEDSSRRLWQIVASVDPNSKEGPAGEGPGELFIETGDMEYTINFSNEVPDDVAVDPENVVPAQLVEVFDEIDADFDIDSVHIGFVGVNDNPPIQLGNAPCYTDTGAPCLSGIEPIQVHSVDTWTVVGDPGDETLVPIRIQGRIDRVERMVTWRFESLDDSAATDAGFLPVFDEESGSDQGSGWVTLAAEVDSEEVGECEEVENDAKIRFDVYDDADEDALNTRITEPAVDVVFCPAPGEPLDPSPADGESVDTLSSLGWVGDGRETTTFDVTVWLDGVVVFDALPAGSENSIELPPLPEAGDYEWQVVATNPRESTPGQVWSFTLKQDPPPPTGVFRRGDVNANGPTDITDAIVLLTYLFNGGPAPTCDDAADATDDEALDITDPIVILNWLFLGGVRPPAPVPDGDCGLDPSGDELGCEQFAAC